MHLSLFAVLKAAPQKALVRTLHLPASPLPTAMERLHLGRWSVAFELPRHWLRVAGPEPSDGSGASATYAPLEAPGRYFAIAARDHRSDGIAAEEGFSVAHSWRTADGRVTTRLLHRPGQAACSDSACAPGSDVFVLDTRVLPRGEPSAADALSWRFAAPASCFRGCWIAVGRPLARSLLVSCEAALQPGPAFDDAGCDPLLWVPRPRLGVRAETAEAAG
jgi:hypothetical protein